MTCETWFKIKLLCVTYLKQKSNKYCFNKANKYEHSNSDKWLAQKTFKNLIDFNHRYKLLFLMHLMSSKM